MKKVQMVAKIGDETLPLGTCHPATARKFVKHEYAAWDDGKLLLLVRPSFIKLLDTSGHGWKGPLDDGNVSDAEMLRRRAWFKSLLPKAVEASANAADRPSGLHHILREAKQSKGPVGFSWDAGYRIVDWREEVAKIPQEEVDGWFTEGETPELNIPDGMWIHEDVEEFMSSHYNQVFGHGIGPVVHQDVDVMDEEKVKHFRQHLQKLAKAQESASEVVLTLGKRVESSDKEDSHDQDALQAEADPD